MGDPCVRSIVNKHLVNLSENLRMQTTLSHMLEANVIGENNYSEIVHQTPHTGFHSLMRYVKQTKEKFHTFLKILKKTKQYALYNEITCELVQHQTEEDCATCKSLETESIVQGYLASNKEKMKKEDYTVLCGEIDTYVLGNKLCEANCIDTLTLLDVLSEKAYVSQQRHISIQGNHKLLNIIACSKGEKEFKIFQDYKSVLKEKCC